MPGRSTRRRQNQGRDQSAREQRASEGGLLSGLRDRASRWLGEHQPAKLRASCRRIEGAGRYVYDQYDDGTIVIVDGPHNVGEVYPPGSVINRAITAEIGAYPRSGAADEGPDADDHRAWYDIPTSLATGEVDWIQQRVDDV